MEICKTFKAETAHRLPNAYSERCRGLHGHSYRFDIVLRGSVADKDGMLQDFGRVKNVLGPFLDAFDHSLLVWEDDQDLVELAPKLNPRHIIVPYQPSAEMMAKHIYNEARRLGLPIHKVRVHETETGFAEYSAKDYFRIETTNVVALMSRVRFSPALEESM